MRGAQGEGSLPLATLAVAFLPVANVHVGLPPYPLALAVPGFFPFPPLSFHRCRDDGFAFPIKTHAAWKVSKRASPL